MAHQALLGTRPSEAGSAWLEVDAALEETTKAAGVAWRLTTPDSVGPVRRLTRRHGRTRIASEIVGLRAALAEAARRGCRAVTVRSPDPALAAVVRGEGGARFHRAADAARRLAPLLAAFDRVTFDPPSPPDPELAHAVAEALDVGLHRAAEREEHRALVMERIVERARQVQLDEKDGTWIANGRYRVSLDPLRCDCPAWGARWARVPIPGRRAERLPCKHLVALALRRGIEVPADLALLARKAPP